MRTLGSLALLSLLVACAEAPLGVTTGAGETAGSESTSESGSSATDTSSDTGTDTETGTPPEPFDPSCGEWSSTLLDARPLTEVLLDGDAIVATGGIAFVERDVGEWSERVDYEHGLVIYDELWGPLDDRWALAHDVDAVIYRSDGESLTQYAVFPDDDPQSVGMLPRELVGRGPDDVWALAAPVCNCFFQPCTCPTVSELQHWDGQSWSSVPTPGQLLDIALTDMGVWGVGHNGLIARFDGQSWTSEPIVPAQLEHVWALDDDEVWVGGLDSQLWHHSGGVWTPVELPEPSHDIVALEGLGPEQVWALDDDGGVWAFDNLAWAKLADIPGARTLAIVGAGESLIVVGGESSHAVWQVETGDGSVTPLHERPQIVMMDMIADDLDHMLVSSFSGHPLWRVTDGVWEPVFDQIGPFIALAGPVDAAIAVRDGTYNPHPVWQLTETPAPLPDPVETGQFLDVIEFRGQPWIAGRDQAWKPDPVVFAWDGASWIDHSPPLIGSDDLVSRVCVADGRLFARLEGYDPQRIMVLDGEDWSSLPSPNADPQLAFADIAATAADRLWATRYAGADQMQLLLWDGAAWTDAASSWPQLAGQAAWFSFAPTDDGGLWMLSTATAGPRSLAYFDGGDWAIVDTPSGLQGWGAAQMIATADGLLIDDGVSLWRYAFCSN